MHHRFSVTVAFLLGGAIAALVTGFGWRPIELIWDSYGWKVPTNATPDHDVSCSAVRKPRDCSAHHEAVLLALC
jgi:hypothetical protein